MNLRRTLLLVAVAASSLFLARPGSADAPVVQTAAILDGAVVVPAAGYLSYPVEVDLSSMTAPTIKGYVQASGGTGNDIDVLVLGDTEFLNWQSGHPVAALYESGKSTAVDVFARPTSSGKYYVVLSNRFSAITPKTVGAGVHLLWVPTALVEAQGRATQNLNLALAVLSILTVAALVLLWVAVAKSRKKAAANSERRAA